MAMNSSGQISLGGTTVGESINIAIGGTGTTTTSLNDTIVRTLAGVPSGQIVMPDDFWGKSLSFPVPIPPGGITGGLDLRAYSLANGWDGVSLVTLDIPLGTTITSTNNLVPALTIAGVFPNGVQITNAGTIAGAPGNAGRGAGTNAGGQAVAGANGGIAVFASTPAEITNTGDIAGGGGGGGGGASYHATGFGIPPAGGGGGGGGANFGVPGQPGISTNTGSAGQPGTLTLGGAGGGGFGNTSGRGGNGGNRGAAGEAGQLSTFWGTSWLVFGPAGGGAAGPSVSGDAFITWLATGNRYGPIV